MKLLILDDDTDLLETLQMVFENDFSVSTYVDCYNLLERTEKEKPDLILLDCWIPDIGGVEATQLLKASALYSHIPVILFSTTLDLEFQAKKAGADDFVKKPFKIRELKEIVLKHIENARAN